MVIRHLNGGEDCAYYTRYVSSRDYSRVYRRGGAGFVIALLTILFHVPIHTALGTSLAGMAFTSLSGLSATTVKAIFR